MDFSNGRNFWLDCDASDALFGKSNRTNHASICKSSRVLLRVRHSEYLLADLVSLCGKGSCAISANDDPFFFCQSEWTGCVDVVISPGADIEPMDYDNHHGWRVCNTILDLILGSRSGNFKQLNG